MCNAPLLAYRWMLRLSQISRTKFTLVMLWRSNFAFGNKSTAILPATAFFGAKARASECVKACLHTQRAQPRFAEGRGSTTRIFTRTGRVIRNNWKFFVAPLFFCRFTKQFLVARRVNFSYNPCEAISLPCCPCMHIKNLDKRKRSA